MIQALLAALTYDFFSSNIEIFLPAPSASFSLFRLSKHAGLSFSHLITHLLSNFLQVDTLHTVRITRYSAKWSGLPGTQAVADLRTRTHSHVFPTLPPSYSTPKSRAFIAFHSWWESRDRRRDPMSRIPPPPLDSHAPIPMIAGILRDNHKRPRGRHLYSAGVQTVLGHGFFPEYSTRFRPQADDNLICPCAALPPRLHTRRHILLQCPLHVTSRQRHFGRHLTLDYILGTEDGGHAFANFVDETGVFLRPLPPRPDPP